jgi:hypothetical protein
VVGKMMGDGKFNGGALVKVVVGEILEVGVISGRFTCRPTCKKIKPTQ